ACTSSDGRWSQCTGTARAASRISGGNFFCSAATAWTAISARRGNLTPPAKPIAGDSTIPPRRPPGTSPHFGGHGWTWRRSGQGCGAMNNTKQIADRLAALCRKGDWEAAQKALYSTDAVSIEQEEMPGASKETKGLKAIIDKGHQWAS